MTWQAIHTIHEQPCVILKWAEGSADKDARMFTHIHRVCVWGGEYTKWGFPQQRSQTPNFACQTPNFLCQTPNQSCQTLNISCQTTKFRSQTPKFRSQSSRQSGAIFPIFRSNLPTSRSMLPAVWSPRGAPRSPLFALSGAKCGVRAQWGPKHPFDPLL